MSRQRLCPITDKPQTEEHRETKKRCRCDPAALPSVHPSEYPADATSDVQAVPENHKLQTLASTECQYTSAEVDVDFDISDGRNDSLYGQKPPRTPTYKASYTRGEWRGDSGLGISYSQNSPRPGPPDVYASSLEAQMISPVVSGCCKPLDSAQEQAIWLEDGQDCILAQQSPSQSRLEDDSAAYNLFDSDSDSTSRGKQLDGEETRFEIIRDESPFAAGYRAMTG